MSWSKKFSYCQSPDCKYTKDGVTSKRHECNGLCLSCHAKRRYAQWSPERRALHLKRGKAYRAAHPEKMESYREKWTAKHPGKKRAANRNASRLRHREFDRAIIVGCRVLVPWSNDFEGAPKPLRVTKRYANVGEDAMCDLTDGKRTFKAVPLKTCTLVVE